MSSLGDSLNMPQPVLQVDCLHSKTGAYDNSFSPAGLADLIDVRQLQRPASPPALTRDSLKLQARGGVYNRVPMQRPRRAAPSSTGTSSTDTCSDDSPTAHPSTTLGDLSTQVSTVVSPSSEYALFVCCILAFTCGGLDATVPGSVTYVWCFGC